MENVKVFFTSIVLYFFMFSANINAQFQDLEVNVSTEQGSVIVENNSNKVFNLKVEVLGGLGVSSSSKTLLEQTNVRNAISTIFEFEDRLRPVIQQDDLFRALGPVIQQDDLFSTPVIQQDDLFAALLPVIQQDDLFSTPVIQQDDLFKFFRVLITRPAVLSAMRTVLNETDGVELLIELFNSNTNSLAQENFTLTAQETKNLEINASSEKYDFVQVKVKRNKGKKKINIIVFP